MSSVTGGTGEVDAEVRAGGGVVTRRGPGDSVDMLLVHRPRYDDWTFPKGKVDPGEGDDAAALREVEEETGLPCRLGPELACSRYEDRKGRTKLVRYWLMVPDGPAHESLAATTGEVDRTAWLGMEEALAALTYDRDRDVLRSAAAALEGQAPA